MQIEEKQWSLGDKIYAAVLLVLLFVVAVGVFFLVQRALLDFLVSYLFLENTLLVNILSFLSAPFVMALWGLGLYFFYKIDDRFVGQRVRKLKGGKRFLYLAFLWLFFFMPIPTMMLFFEINGTTTLFILASFLLCILVSVPICFELYELLFKHKSSSLKA